MTAPITVQAQLKSLEKVQELDLQLDRLKADSAAIPAALQAIDESIASLEKQSAASKLAIGELEKSIRQNRAALELNTDRLTRSTTRLEGVQNSVEFSALNKEIEQLKKLNLTLTEANAKAETEIAKLREKQSPLADQIQAKQGERAERAAASAGSTEKLRADIAKLDGERTAAAKSIEARVIAMYNRVRGVKNGQGLSPAISGRCKACNMMIPPQANNELQKGVAFHQCSTCHRFLYIPGK